MEFEGANFFRQRLVLSVVSGKAVKLKKIRHEDSDPGLREYEASFIRLLDKITNGTKIVISTTGTSLLFEPGLLMGGTVEHDCNPQRSIGYYLEALLCLAPFTKNPLHVTLSGVTNSQTDLSVDLIKLSLFPVLKKFLGTDEDLDLKIVKRGAAPEGGGQVIFSSPCRQKLRPIQFTDPGKIKRVRGVAWAVRVSPAITNRIVNAARGILNQFLTDIYIYTDSCKGKQTGRSPGFGLTLVAETTNGAFLAAEATSNPKGSTEPPSIPEDIGKQAAQLLLEEIYRGGCVDSSSQSLAVLCMVLGQQDVSKVQTGPLSPYTIQFLRHIRQFLQVMFKVETDKGEQMGANGQQLKTGGEKLILTCVGVGYSNISKRVA